MTTRAGWGQSGSPPSGFGPNAANVERLLARVAELSRSEIVRLDLAEAADGKLMLVAWDHLRDRMRNEPVRSWRFAARAASWQAYGKAAGRLGLSAPLDDDYWRAAHGVGFGAARIARYVACALVAPELLDPEHFERLLAPWRAVVGDPVLGNQLD